MSINARLVATPSWGLHKFAPLRKLSDLRTMSEVPKHEQTHIEYLNRSADVDEGIAPLVLVLWELGYETTGSCEAYVHVEGFAYVTFTTKDQAHKFMRAVGAEGRLVVPGKTGADEYDEWNPPGSAAVFFPPRDLGRLVAKLRRDRQRWMRDPLRGE